MFVLLPTNRLRFARRHQTATEAGERKELFKPCLMTNERPKFAFADTPARECRFQKLLVEFHLERAAPPESMGNPIGHDLIAHLNLQVIQFFGKKKPPRDLDIEVEELLTGFSLFGPAAGRKEVLQTRLLLHLLVFPGTDGPAVDVAKIARSPAEDAAPTAPPAGGRIQEIDE